MLTKSYFNFSLLFFRVALSASLLTHGYGKFLKLINGDFEFADPLGVGAVPSLFFAVLGEFIAPIFIIFGFKTRWASLMSVITMAVITFIVHADDPFKGKEKAVLFCIGFILLFLQGPGKFSIDKK